MDSGDWQWDETLYAGSAVHYAPGRMPYPPALADAVRDELGLDGTGALLDVGCGPGTLTLLLAPMFASAIGLDPDPGMIGEARRRTAEAGIDNVEWRRMRAEELPADLGRFRVVSFAQSFHWMDRPLVARRVAGMLDPDGAWLHIGARTHRGDTAPGTPPGPTRPGTVGPASSGPSATRGPESLPFPSPPWERIDALVARYLGPVRRAGRSVLPHGTPGGEETVMREAGYTGPTRLSVEGGQTVVRDVDAIVSAVYSLSSSAPHLFADQLARFETELRALLADSADNGRFAERTTPVEVVIWRP